MKLNYATNIIALASIFTVGFAASTYAISSSTNGSRGIGDRSEVEAIANPGGAANPPVEANLYAAKGQSSIYVKNGLAIGGTDPVAYFEQGRPIEGSSQFEYQWNGATWRFHSEANKALFVSNPEEYAPQYGGYCSYAVSRGYTAKTEPEAWTIVDGKLYLNFSLDVRDLWSQDIPGNIAKADRNWPGVLEQ